MGIDLNRLPDAVKEQLLAALQVAPGKKSVAETGRGGPGINIPLTPQTDPNNFPPYQYIEWPKMLVKRATREDVRFHQDTFRPEDGHGAAPRVGDPVPIYATAAHVESGFAEAVNTPIIFEDERHEAEFLAAFPDAVEEVDLPSPVAQLVTENPLDELQRLLRENAELRARADKAEAKPKRRKYRRRKRVARHEEAAGKDGGS